MTSVNELRRRTLEALTRPSYSISNKGMVLLNDNANLFGVNPAVDELARTFDFGRLWAYPSENSDALRERVGSEFGASPEEVIVGNGSDEILDIVSKCFINPGETFCSPTPTFSMYKFYARLHLARISEKILRDDFSLNPGPLIDEGAKLTALCQPNNPTAVLFEPADVKRVLNESRGIVLLDEAYADFCGSDMLGDVMAAERAIDVRTLSKAYGIAGLRVGFAISRKEIVDEMRSFRTPFGLNSFAEAVAISAMDNKAWIREVVAQVRSAMAYMRPKLEALGFRVYPSDCNFLLCRAPVPSPGLVSTLRSEGVAIRDCNSYPLLENHVRITMAPRPMLDTLLEKLEGILRGDSG